MSSMFVIVSLVAAPVAAEAPSLVPFTPHPNGFVTAWLVADSVAGPPGGSGGLDADLLGGEAEAAPADGQRLTVRGQDALGHKPLGRVSFLGLPPSLGRESFLGPSPETVPRWTAHVSAGEVVEVDALPAPQAGGVAYAYAVVVSPRSVDAQLRFGSTGPVRIWLEGEVVLHVTGKRAVRVDTDVVEVQLRKGINRLLVKADVSAGPARFVLRLTDKRGRAVRGLYTALPASRDRDAVLRLFRQGLRFRVTPALITDDKTARLTLQLAPCLPAIFADLRLGFGVTGPDGEFTSLLIKNAAPGDRAAETPWNVADLPGGTYTAVVKVQTESAFPLAELTAVTEKATLRTVRVVLRDRATGKRTGARVSFVDSRGRCWPPRRSPLDAATRPGLATSTDTDSFVQVGPDFFVDLPPGTIDVRIQRHPDAAPLRQTWHITRDRETRIIRLDP